MFTLPLVPVLSQVNVVYKFLPYTFKIHFYIIPHLYQGLLNGFSFKVFWPKSYRYFWLLPCMLHTPPRKKVSERKNAVIFTHMSYNNLHVKSPELIFKFHRSDIKMHLLTCKSEQESPVQRMVVWCHPQPSLALSHVFPLLFLAEHFLLVLQKAHSWQFNKVLHTVNLFVQQAIIIFSQYLYTQSSTFTLKTKAFWSWQDHTQSWMQPEGKGRLDILHFLDLCKKKKNQNWKNDGSIHHITLSCVRH